jgi:anti-sigma factor ChrR (cupin superfamily)
MVNADLACRAVLRPEQLDWTPSQIAGIEERCLEQYKLGRNVLGTRLLRLAPGASLGSLANGGCEDVMLLDGELRDGQDAYPAGTYLHSPPGSSHVWMSPGGCTMLVKTRPTGDHDRYRVVVDTNVPSWRPARSPGVWIMPLRELTCSRVVLLRLDPQTHIEDHAHIDGEEFYVLRGSISDEDGSYPTGTWVRQPPGSHHRVHAGDGCTLWTTAGHLTPDLIARVR